MNKEFKGTPWPWSLSTVPFELRNSDSAACIYKDTMHGNEIGSSPIADISRAVGDEQATNNAKLIASAPELLDALQQFMDAETRKEIEQCRKLASKAISKALD